MIRLNKKLTKKTILAGAIIAGVAAIPITGVLAYEIFNNKNVETATVAQYLKGNSVDSNVTKMNKPEMNGEQPPELPDGEKPEMNGEQLPELLDGEKPEMNGEQPPELPDGEKPEMNGEQPPELPDGEKPEMNGEQPPELPDGEKLEMNGEQPPELPDGEKPEMNGEQPSKLPDGTMPEITNNQQNNDQGFFEMLKNLPSNFVNWLKDLFNKK